jgi:hypothetical protein
MKQLDLLGELPTEDAPRGVLPATADDGLSALASRLDPRLRLGTSSWSFPGWAGLVYAGIASKQSLSRDGLTAYSRHPLLRTVGVDSGFYAPLDARRLARYAEQVPLDFRFLVKAPASITDRFRRAAGGRSGSPIPAFSIWIGLGTGRDALPRRARRAGRRAAVPISTAGTDITGQPASLRRGPVSVPAPPSARPDLCRGIARPGVADPGPRRRAASRQRLGKYSFGRRNLAQLSFSR